MTVREFLKIDTAPTSYIHIFDWGEVPAHMAYEGERGKIPKDATFLEKEITRWENARYSVRDEHATYGLRFESSLLLYVR